MSEVRRDELLRTAEYWSKASIFDVLNAKNIKRNFELEKNRHVEDENLSCDVDSPT